MILIEFILIIFCFVFFFWRIELPSGYIFNYDKIDSLRKDNPDIKRIDMKNSNTLGVFYFDKVSYFLWL